MKKFQIKTKKGNNFQASILENDVIINGSKFYFYEKNILKSHDVESFCNELGISSEGKSEIILELCDESSETLYYAMYPSRKAVKFLRKHEDTNVHFEGETFTTGEVWLMADGSEKVINKRVTHR